MESAREFAEYLIAFLNGPTYPLQVLTLVVFIIGLAIPKLMDTFSVLSKTTIERSDWRSRKIDEIDALLAVIDKTAPIAAERRFKELFGFDLSYDEIVAFSKCKEQTKLLFLLRHKFDFVIFDRITKTFRFSRHNPSKDWIDLQRNSLLIFYGTFIYAAIDFLPRLRPYDLTGGGLIICCLLGYVWSIILQSRYWRATKYALSLFLSGDIQAR